MRFFSPPFRGEREYYFTTCASDVSSGPPKTPKKAYMSFGSKALNCYRLCKLSGDVFR